MDIIPIIDLDEEEDIFEDYHKEPRRRVIYGCRANALIKVEPPDYVEYDEVNEPEDFATEIESSLVHVKSEPVSDNEKDVLSEESEEKAVESDKVSDDEVVEVEDIHAFFENSPQHELYLLLKNLQHSPLVSLERVKMPRSTAKKRRQIQFKKEIKDEEPSPLPALKRTRGKVTEPEDDAVVPKRQLRTRIEKPKIEQDVDDEEEEVAKNNVTEQVKNKKQTTEKKSKEANDDIKVPVEKVQSTAALLMKARIASRVITNTKPVNTQKTMLKCELCGIDIVDLIEMTKHLQDIHKVTKTFTCNVCSVSYPTQSQLAIHRDRYHNTNRWLRCTDCNVGFKHGTSLFFHQKVVHHKPTGSCPVCRELFDSALQLQNHLEVHLQSVSMGNTVSGQANVGIPSQAIQPTVPAKTTPAVKTESYKCSLCSEILRSQSDFISHMQSHKTIKEEPRPVSGATDFNCKICGQECASTNSLISHQEIHEKKLNHWKCKLCSYILRNQLSLEYHIEKVHGVKPDKMNMLEVTYNKDEKTVKDKDKIKPAPVKTEVDGKKGSSLKESEQMDQDRSTIKRERHSSASDDSSFDSEQKTVKTTCPLCKMKFSLRDQLENHWINSHRMKLYACKNCDKNFLYSEGQKRHQKHGCKTAIRRLDVQSLQSSECSDGNMGGVVRVNLDCPRCKISFRKRSGLEEHWLEAHRQTLYRCEMCDNDLLSYISWHKHCLRHVFVQQHARHFCKACGKGFLCSEKHSKHMKVKHKKDAIDCKFCGKSFYTEGALKNHVFNVCLNEYVKEQRGSGDS